MSITRGITKLRTLFAKQESTFNTASLSGLDTDYRIDAEDITWEPTQEFIERAVQLDVLGPVPGVIGGKGGKVSFKLGLRSTGVQAQDNPGALAAPFDDILSAASLDLTSTSAASLASDTPASKTNIKTAESGDVLAPFVGVTTLVDGSASGAVTVRAVRDISGDPTIVLAPPVASNFASTQSIVPSVFALPEGEPSGNTVTLLALGDGYQYVFTGCRAPPPKISGQAGKRIMMEFAFEVTSWTKTNYDVTQFPPLDLPAAILALQAPFYWKAGEATPQATPIAEFTFDFGAKLQAIMSTEAADGKAGWVISEMKPKLTVKPYYSTGWATDFAAGTVDLAMLQLGTVGGSVVALLLPNAQITKYPAETDIGGVIGHEVEFTGTIGADFGGGESSAAAGLGFF